LKKSIDDSKINPDTQHSLYAQNLQDRGCLSEPGPGDVLVFADAAYPCHCGFFTAKHGVPHLRHAHALQRKVLEEPYAGEWPLKVKLAFRFRVS
jgi:hypothetical protein